ncbi:hypothetical protein ZWY2020_047695 [Hordeum vulgare]|nr:hypothetical protein ZWY2020_047695 [Hordeum vulgare]
MEDGLLLLFEVLMRRMPSQGSMGVQPGEECYCLPPKKPPRWISSSFQILILLLRARNCLAAVRRQGWGPPHSLAIGPSAQRSCSRPMSRSPICWSADYPGSLPVPATMVPRELVDPELLQRHHGEEARPGLGGLHRRRAAAGRRCVDVRGFELVSGDASDRDESGS